MRLRRNFYGIVSGRALSLARRHFYSALFATDQRRRVNKKRPLFPQTRFASLFYTERLVRESATQAFGLDELHRPEQALVLHLRKLPLPFLRTL